MAKSLYKLIERFKGGIGAFPDSEATFYRIALEEKLGPIRRRRNPQC
jgi:hypothetical protein